DVAPRRRARRGRARAGSGVRRTRVRRGGAARRPCAHARCARRPPARAGRVGGVVAGAPARARRAAALVRWQDREGSFARRNGAAADATRQSLAQRAASLAQRAEGERRPSGGRAKSIEQGGHMNEHITRYDRMPIPPVEAQTTWFEAGAVRIGVEYRLLNEAIAAAGEEVARDGGTTQPH